MDLRGLTFELSLSEGLGVATGTAQNGSNLIPFLDS